MFLSEWREFPSALCLAGKETDDTSHFDVVKIARVPDTFPSLFPSWSGWGLISTPIAALLLNLGTQWVWVVSISFLLITPGERSACAQRLECLKRRNLLGTFAKLRNATTSYVMSVRPFASNNSAPTGRIFMKFCPWIFCQNLSKGSSFVKIWL